METIVLIRGKDGIATVRLNRPDKRNALSPQMLRELLAVFEDLSSDEQVRVIVLEGSGSAFCAGADLEYLHRIRQFSSMENLDDSLLFEQTFYRIFTTPKVTIAKVHGPAIAGGCGLATICDLVVASRQRALFGYSEVRIGFIPAIVGVYLVRKVGEAVARRLLLTAEMIGAEEAQRMGLVSDVVDHEQLDSTVDGLAAKLVANSASSLALTKRLFTDIHGMDLRSALQHAAALNVIARGTEDCRSRIEEFLTSTKAKQ